MALSMAHTLEDSKTSELHCATTPAEGRVPLSPPHACPYSEMFLTQEKFCVRTFWNSRGKKNMPFNVFWHKTVVWVSFNCNYFIRPSCRNAHNNLLYSIIVSLPFFPGESYSELRKGPQTSCDPTNPFNRQHYNQRKERLCFDMKHQILTVFH